MKISVWSNLSEQEQRSLLQRSIPLTQTALLEKVQYILQEVKQKKDKALFDFTAQFDHVELKQLMVDKSEIDASIDLIHPEDVKAVNFAKTQIEKFNQQNFVKEIIFDTHPGVHFKKRFIPIERVGLYIPAGSAPLVSTLLMLAVPAQIAGCPVRVLATPPNEEGDIDPLILYTARLCGIEKIFKIGGAQAIAALAFGTESIPKVDKIFGPGNAWVTLAKQLVQGEPDGAAIDMPAGPSEVLVIADDYADPDIIAADLLSQAEHGLDSQVVLITTSQQHAEEVLKSINQLRKGLSRQSILDESLRYMQIIIVDNLEDAIHISNLYAPEHLIINCSDPESLSQKVINAGTVFLGPWSAEALGDYVSGSSHVLPTHGWAKSYSGLTILHFGKIVAFQTIQASGLTYLAPSAQRLAECEGLDAHQLAVTLRMRKLRELS